MSELEVYNAALKAANMASTKFRAISLDYRARKIGDDEFLKARAEHDKAQAAFDAAEKAYDKTLAGSGSSKIAKKDKMPRINPHSSVLIQDEQLRRQNSWLKKTGFKTPRDAQNAGY